MFVRSFSTILLVAFSLFSLSACQPSSFNNENDRFSYLREVETGVKRKPDKINEFSKLVTVLVKGSSLGSGVIINQSGETYYVLTTQDIIGENQNLTIVTAEGDEYKGNDNETQFFPSVGLAVVTFKSSKNYPLPELGNSALIEDESPIYIAGFNSKGTAIDKSKHLFSPGKLVDRDNKVLEYTNRTLTGMKGGAVFNEYGRLLGIHGGDNQGIPIHAFLRLNSLSELNWETRIPFDFTLDKYDSELKLVERKELKNITTYNARESSSRLIMDENFNIHYIKRFNKKHKNARGFSKNYVQTSSIIKQDLQGKIAFEKTFDTSSGNDLSIEILGVDNNNNFYTYSNESYIYKHKTNFGNIENRSRTLNHFLAKYNSQGEIEWKKDIKQWLKNIDGFSLNVNDQEIYIDLKGNTYLIVNNYLINKGEDSNNKYFIIKIDPHGVFLWKKEIKIPVEIDPFGVRIDSSIKVDKNDNIYLFVRRVLITLDNTTKDWSDNWILKYDSTGQLIDTIKLPYPCINIAHISTSHIDNNENIYCISTTDGSIANFHLSDQIKVTHPFLDIIVAKYSNKGSLIWKKQWGNNKNNSVDKFLLDSQNNLYLAGKSHTISFCDIHTGCDGESSNWLIQLGEDGQIKTVNKWKITNTNLYWEDTQLVYLDDEKNLNLITGLFDEQICCQYTPINIIKFTPSK